MSHCVVLNKLESVLIIGDSRYALSKNEVLLLECLYLRAGDVISHDELLTTCWPDRVVSPTSLPVAIKHIRDVFRKITRSEVIKTYKNEGYSYQKDSVLIIIDDGSTEKESHSAAYTRKEKPDIPIKLVGLQILSHLNSTFFIAIMMVIIIIFFMVGGNDIVSFIDSDTNSVIITNVTTKMNGPTAGLPKVKNSMIFKDDLV